MIRTGILSIPERDDEAIDQLRLLLRESIPAAIVLEETSAKSQQNWIEEVLRKWADEEELDLILTLGGTYPAPGPSSAEIVPEATLAVVERLLPGLSEAMRAVAHEETELALLDRGVAGIRGRTLILNLPAGAAAARLFLSAISDVIPSILAYLQGAAAPPQIEDEIESGIENEDDFQTLPNKKAGSPSNKRGLDPAEFAEFLRRQKDD